LAGEKEMRRALVVGGGLAGMAFAATYGDAVVFEARKQLGGFFASDELKVGEHSGRELVERLAGRVRALLGETVFEAEGNGVWSVGVNGAEFHEGLPVLATGFREKTPVELGVYGFRPAGVFPLTAAWDLVNAGYSIGERVVVYGFNHYSLSLISKIHEVCEKVAVVYDEESYVHKPEEAGDYGAELVKGRVLYVEGRQRVERLRTSAGYVEADTLVLAKLAPLRLLEAELAVGNAGMVIEDPAKVAESARLLALTLTEGGELGRVHGEVPVVPSVFSMKHPYVMVGVPSGAKLEVAGRVLSAEEPYPVVELPPERKVVIRVV